ncbi:hypothetical protein DFH06DRAFT_1365592 [Mycena polygramma]|nr:hypothetical protein DFH06DRAFT_1365592 [Mycena polygramma]
MARPLPLPPRTFDGTSRGYLYPWGTLIEAIPDVLWGPRGRRHIYDEPLGGLMNNAEVDLLGRISTLLESCDSGLLTSAARKHRQICCYRAIWALCSLVTTDASLSFLNLRMEHTDWREMDKDVMPYSHSAYALHAWAVHREVQRQAEEILQELTNIEQDTVVTRNISPILSRVSHITFLASTRLDIALGLDSLESSSAEDLLLLIKALTHEISKRSALALLHYLDNAKLSNVQPHQFTQSLQLMCPDTEVRLAKWELEQVTAGLDWIIWTHLENSDLFLQHTTGDEDSHWMDIVFRTQLSYWEPDMTSRRKAFLWAAVQYLNERNSEFDVREAALALRQAAWTSIPPMIRDGPSMSDSYIRLRSYNPGAAENVPASLKATWTLLFYRWRSSHTHWGDISFLESSLDAILKTSCSSITPSVVAMTKHALLCELLGQFGNTARFSLGAGEHKAESITLEGLIARSSHPILPVETSWAAMISPEVDETEEWSRARLGKALQNKCTEARVQILSEFIQHCCAEDTPFKAAETLDVIGHFRPTSAVHPSHQLRFATAVKETTEASTRVGGPLPVGLLHRVLDVCYSGSPATLAMSWIDDPDARDMLEGCFKTYAVDQNPDRQIAARLKDIVAHLEFLKVQPPY